MEGGAEDEVGLKELVEGSERRPGPTRDGAVTENNKEPLRAGVRAQSQQVRLRGGSEAGQVLLQGRTGLEEKYFFNPGSDRWSVKKPKTYLLEDDQVFLSLRR